MSQNDSHDGNQWGRGNEEPTTTEPMQEILSRLYLGEFVLLPPLAKAPSKKKYINRTFHSLTATGNMELLRRNNISFVLSIKHKNLARATRDAYQRVRISHVHIVKRDTLCEDLLSILGPACDMIEGGLATGRAVLVHCALGKSRSATVVIAYGMWIALKSTIVYMGRLIWTSCSHATYGHGSQ